jgi:hypothetical protein
VLARILPFAIYLFFLALAETFSWLAHNVPAVASWGVWADLWLYPVKITVVLGVLLYYWPAYDELKEKRFGGKTDVLLSVGVGFLIYLIWVRTDWPWAMQGNPSGYNPFLAGEGMSTFLASARILGAAVVVPIMEELFWRSFLLRYLISPKFQSVPLGSFSAFSFLATMILFGLEHHLWLAGMVAGAAYSLVLYRTRRLWPCIIAHGVTNLILGIHVLLTKEWIWW